MQDEVHRDGGGDFHGLAIQHGGLEDPLPYGVQRRIDQQRMPAQYLELVNPSVGAEYAEQFHGAGYTRLFGQRRVDRFDLVERRGHAKHGDARRFDRRRRRLHRFPIDHFGRTHYRHDTRAFIDDAVHQAAGHSIANAAGHTAWNAWSAARGFGRIVNDDRRNRRNADRRGQDVFEDLCGNRMVRLRHDLRTGRRWRRRSAGRRQRSHQKCTPQSLRRNQRGQQRTADQQRLPGEPHHGGPNPFGGWTVGKCCRLKHGVLLSLRRADTLRASKKIAGNAPQRPVRLVVVIAFNLHPNRHHVVRKVPRVERCAPLIAPSGDRTRRARPGPTSSAARCRQSAASNASIDSTFF